MTNTPFLNIGGLIPVIRFDVTWNCIAADVYWNGAHFDRLVEVSGSQGRPVAFSFTQWCRKNLYPARYLELQEYGNGACAAHLRRAMSDPRGVLLKDEHAWRGQPRGLTLLGEEETRILYLPLWRE